MGKLGPRLASRKKAKRWPKGQSSNSNPETQKYRDQARSRFFQQNLGTTGLTADALKKHDALQGLESSEKIDVDADESSMTGTFKTFNTFASDFSQCTNMSFNKFLTRFQSSSLIHKEMLAILAAVTDVIKQNGGAESSTEYYAALMTTLEQAETEESVAAILSLLGMGLQTVPKNVIMLQFSQACPIFIHILTKYAESENFLIIRHCIGCLSILLRSLEAAAWSASSTTQILEGILIFTVHTKPKVRKAAQHAICAILKGSDLMKAENPPVCHPAAGQVAKHCLRHFENAGQPGTTTTILHILTLLKDILHQLPKSYVKSLCESLLQIMTLKNPLVTSCCLQTFHSLFVSRPSESVLPSQLNAQIINALYDYQPAPSDTQPTTAWLAVMQEAHARLATTSLHLCAANIPRIIEKSSELWLSDKSEVITAASHTIKTLIQLCITPLCENESVAAKYQKPLKKVIQLIRQGLKYQCNSAWHHVLHLISVLFQVVGPNCRDNMLPLLNELADLRDSFKFTYNSEVEYAVGAAVKSLGPELVLSRIPLQTPAAGGVDLKRSWMLPVLKDCVSQASLLYFINHLLPLATMCEKKHKELKEKNDGIGAHSYELLTSQIWSLLPSFCNNPSDIKENFKSIARILGMALSDRKDLRLSVMASLRKLITKSVESNKTEDVEELSRFAKNYLPLLFNLYTTKPNGSDEEGQRLAAFDTIKVYLSITSKELCGELFDKAIQKIQDPDQNEFVKQSVFDLIRVLTQFTDRERLQALYDKFLPILMENKNPKDQKKAYRFFEEISGSESEVCRDFITENRRALQKVLMKAAPTVCTTSRSPRLRCVTNLIKTHPKLEKTEFLKSIVPEIVTCVKDLNEKCRTTAYQLLNEIADKFLSSPGYFDEYIQMVVVGLGGNPTYASATLLSLANITYKYNGSIGTARNQEILGHTCTLLTSPTREIVLSALSYVKVYLSSFPTIVIGPNLKLIIEGLTGMTDDCKRHFRQKVRDILVKLIRKFGIETVTAMIPASDELMHKRIKNIRKIEARKQKLKEQKKALKDGKDNDEDEFNINRRPKTMEEILADSDEDFDDSDNDTSKKAGKRKISTQRQAWIQEDAENIVDFADPSATKNITATKPGQNSSVPKKTKPKDHGFKTAGDGRLIIKDSDDDSELEEDPSKKKRKNKLPFLGSDSDDNYEDVGDDDGSKSVASAKPEIPRKRKLSGSTDAASSVGTSRYRAGGSGIHRPTKALKVDKTPGVEYTSRKAAGDVKKTGKPDPYAYLPLTRAALNRRKKLKNKGRFKGIISGAKKGAQAGSKARRRKQ